MGYSEKIKEAIIKKAITGNKSNNEVARESGIAPSTLNKWMRELKEEGDKELRKVEKRPKDWKHEERFEALLTTGSMTKEECSSWCRKNGLFPHNLEQWKKDFLKGSTEINKSSRSKDFLLLKKENLKLKKDLEYKEKALAETAALLVLKKKADLIWGVKEEG